MEPTLAENGAAESNSNAKPCRSARVERLLKLIDALSEEVKQSIDVIDDEGLQTVSSRFNRAQEALNSEHELRKRIPSETLEKLKQKELPDRVKLNVGGKVFATCLAALTCFKGTFFDSMFGGRWPLTPEAGGTFSICRDPKGFSMVLQFLHGRNFDRNTVSDGEITAFIEDVDYYGLPVESVEQWLGKRLSRGPEQWSSEEHTTGMSVTEDNLVARHGAVGRYFVWALGCNTYCGQDHVVIALSLEYVTESTIFGVIGGPPASNHSWNDSTCYGFDSNYRWCAGYGENSGLLTFTNGDTIEVEIDCSHNKLTVRNLTKTMEGSMGLPASKQWRLHVNMYKPGECVRIIDCKRL